MSPLRIALIQLRTPGDQAAALAQAEPLIRHAAGQGARLILTPEASNMLQRDRTRMLAHLRPLDEDAFVEGVRSLARELGVWILIGSALVARPDGKAANRAVAIDASGAIVGTYDKLHMFDVDLPTGERHRESALYTPGERAEIVHAPWADIGLSICYDIRFPHLYRALAKAGASILTVPAAFTVPTGRAHWEVLLRARAIESGAFVLAPAQGGTHEDGRSTWGHSMVVDPWGTVLAQADGDEPGVILADLDLEAVAKARAAIPALAHDRPYGQPGASA